MSLSKLIPQVIKTPLSRFLLSKSAFISQAGQDYWVCGEVFNGKEKGFYLDIGAHDGVYISNTYILEAKYKWSGICIEANPTTYSELKKNRNAICLNVCLDRTVGEVEFIMRDVMGGITGLDNKDSDVKDNNAVKLKTLPLIDVLDSNNAPKIIDYLSIDVEGAEERVLAEFDFQKYKFRCITIERPSDILRNIFKINGYVLVKELPGLDCFYVHREFIDEYMINLIAFYKSRYIGLKWK